jgi:hypothetical protein
MDPIDWGIGVAIASGSIGSIVMATLILRAALARWVKPSRNAPSHQLEEMRAGLNRLTDEVAELHERLDFAERVLARQRDLARLREQA